MKKLNKEQLEAVHSPFKPTLVIAGAGTGKTTVLIERIIYLIRSGVPCRKILVITFSNNAKLEVLNRVSENIKSSDSIHIYTFHAFFLRILRKDIRRIRRGKKNTFKVIDESEKLSMLKQIISFVSVDDQEAADPLTPRKIIRAISSMKKTRFILLKEALDSGYFSGFVKKVIAEYQRHLDLVDGFDFDDFEIFASRLLSIENVRNNWSFKYDAILVDEFQDTSKLQFDVIKKIAGKNGNIFCVGDPDQSIYSFRGAYPSVCFEYVDNFDNPTIIKLEQNYRSTKNIVAVANHLINVNKTKFSKTLFAQNPQGSKVTIRGFRSEDEEFEWILQEVKSIKEKSVNDTCVILYRTNDISKSFEKFLQEKGWKYSWSKKVEILHLEEIKDVMAYLKLIFSDKGDIQSLGRIIGKPKRGIGSESLKTFESFISRNELSVLEGLSEVHSINGLSKNAIDGFLNIASAIKELKRIKDQDIKVLILTILSSIYREYLEKQGDKVEEKIRNVEYFAEILYREHNRNGMSGIELLQDVVDVEDYT